MKFTGLAAFMGVTGSVSGRKGIQWLDVPSLRQDGSYASILGLQEIGRRQLRIASTVKREIQPAVPSGKPGHASTSSV